MSTIKLMQGDCLERMKDIPDNSVDMVLTDIPYGEINRYSNGLRNLDKGIADIETFEIEPFVFSLCRICKGSIYIFCSVEQVSEIRGHLQKSDLSTRLIIWEKTNPSPMNGEHIWLSGIECCVFGKKKGATFNEFCKNTVLRYPCGKNDLHPTQKPIEMLEYLISVSSNEKDLIFDPCMGSGSTGIACINTQRNFIGIELDENYFKISSDRIEKAQQQITLFDLDGEV